MKKYLFAIFILIGLAWFFATPFDANATIAFVGNSASSSYGASVSEYTISYFITGSDPGLIVSIMTTAGGDNVTGVTFNGDALTRIDTQAVGSYQMFLYELENPDAGKYNLVVTCSGSNNIFVGAGTYSGVDQTDMIDSTNKVTVTGTALTIYATSTVDNGWLISAVSCNSGPSVIATSTGTTRRILGGGTDYAGLVDSGNVTSPAGQDDNAITSTSQTLGMIAAFLIPAGGAPPAAEDVKIEDIIIF